ncbi:MAG TPA: IS5 family transposase [Paenibacillus sp.]
MALAFEKRYGSDLTYGQWKRIEALIPPAKPGGHPRVTCVHCVMNAIFYRLKNGCTWRDLPKDFPHWETVYDYYRQWSLDGTLERIHDVLRREVRKQAGKAETPTACIIDSQSVKTVQKGGSVATMRGKSSRVASLI